MNPSPEELRAVSAQVQEIAQDEAAEAGYLPPLTPASTQARRNFAGPAPAQDFIIPGFLPAGIPAALTAQGGAGKTFWLLILANAVTAGRGFASFPAMAPQPVLMILAEDSHDEIHRRVSLLGDLAPDLHIAVMTGKIAPLMYLENSRPVRSPTYDWLRRTLANYPGLRLLILDPKSRLFGLDEQSNDHNTQWVQCLEALCVEFGLTILFSHHVSKVRASELSQHSSRGASALVDACRWVAALAPMKDATAKTLGVEEPRKYFELDVVKTNHSAGLEKTLFFRRGPGGLPQYSDLYRDALGQMIAALQEQIEASPVPVSRRDIAKSMGPGQVVNKAMKEIFPAWTREQGVRLIDASLRDGTLIETMQSGDKPGKSKMAIQVVGIGSDEPN